ncbi:PLP-dependent transferase [Pelomonas caseinilytica]|uniref:PLP-dependent transferase n=1 Tax=Pelomonas caseinilytica TaxID=2906763 RepID=UPI003B02CB28
MRRWGARPRFVACETSRLGPARCGPLTFRARLGITDALVRLSVGIEDVADLRRDLAAALAAV